MNDINNPFDFFDHIYLITTEDASTRYQNTLLELEKVGIRERTDCLLAQDVSPGAGEDYIVDNIFWNKYIAFLDASNNGYENILLLEDDIVFEDNALEHLEQSLKDLPEDWDALYLGGHIGANLYHEEIEGEIIRSNFDPNGPDILVQDYVDKWKHYKKVGEHLIKSNDGLFMLLYGVAFNRKFFDKFMNAYADPNYENKDPDVWLAIAQEDPSNNFYMSLPFVATPRPDISGRTHQWFEIDIINNPIVEILKNKEVEI